MWHILKYVVNIFLTNRKGFHLLKKNSKLLRELKNLDSRQWWVSSAVIEHHFLGFSDIPDWIDLYSINRLAHTFFNSFLGKCLKPLHSLFESFCSPAERLTSLLCSTLERAKRTSAPSCPTARAVRPSKILCLVLDGRYRQLYPRGRGLYANADVESS